MFIQVNSNCVNLEKNKTTKILAVKKNIKINTGSFNKILKLILHS